MKHYINWITRHQLFIIYDDILMREVYLILTKDTTALLHNKEDAKAIWQEGF